MQRASSGADSGSTHSKSPLRLKEIVTFTESRLGYSKLALHTEKNVLVTIRKNKKDMILSPLKNLMKCVNLYNFSSILQSFIK